MSQDTENRENTLEGRVARLETEVKVMQKEDEYTKESILKIEENIKASRNMTITQLALLCITLLSVIFTAVLGS